MPSSDLESAILNLLRARGYGKTICPSDPALAVAPSADPSAWRPLMKPTRAAVLRLVAAGKILVTQHGRPVDPRTAKGPICLRLRQNQPEIRPRTIAFAGLINYGQPIPHLVEQAASYTNLPLLARLRTHPRKIAQRKRKLQTKIPPDRRRARV